MGKPPEGLRHRRAIDSFSAFVKSPAFLFGIVLLVCTIVKLASTNSRELWLDETYSAFIANLSFANILRYSAGDVHPPVFYFLLRLWVLVLGDAQAQLRMFSLVLNFFSSVALYFFARRILGVRFGAFAAALFALSPAVFVYSLEVRMYMLMTLLLLGLLVVHWLIVVEERESRWLIGAYAVIAALLFYVHDTSIFFLAGLFIHWLLTTAFLKRRLIRFVTALLLTGVLTAPGIPVILHQFAGKTQQTQMLTRSYSNPEALSFSGGVVPPPDQSKGITAVPKSLAAVAGLYPATSPVILLLCAIPLLLSVAGMIFLATVKKDELCRLFFVVGIAALIGLTALKLTNTRYTVPLIPLLVLAMARGLQYWTAKPQFRALGLAVGTLILCVYGAGFYRQAAKPHGRPWENIVSAVQQNYHPEDTVVFDALYMQVPFDYFAGHAGFHPNENGFPLPIYSWWNSQAFKGWGSPVILKSDLEHFVSRLAAAKPRGVWLVIFEDQDYDPHDALLARLSQIGQVTEIHLPPDPDDKEPQLHPPPRLIHISIN